MKKFIVAALALLAALGGTARAEGTNWSEVLKSDTATLQQKADACRELARAGGPESIPALAALLGDEHLAQRARTALEAMAHPAADAALREAAGRLTGLRRVGAISSLGVRRDAAAVPLLASLLGDADAEVAAAAAKALGLIGESAGAKPLMEALAAAPADRKPALADGCLLCAERVGDARLAARLAEAVASASVPEALRLAAMRLQIRAGGAAGTRLLVEQLRAPELPRFNLALGEAQIIKDKSLTGPIADALAGQSDDRRVSLLALLGERGDRAAAPVLLKEASAGTNVVRVAAIAALGRLGEPTTVEALVGLAADPDAAVASAASAALAGFPEGAADQAIIARLGHSDPAARALAITLVGQRRLAGAVPPLLRLAGETDAATRDPALKVLADLAGPADVPALIRILQATPSRPLAERALLAAATRAEGGKANDIVVRSAVYGKLPDGPQQDVSKKVTELLAAGKREFEVSNAQFGDAAPGLVKSFVIEYTQAGRPGRLSAKENETVSFPSTGMSATTVDALCGALPAAAGEVKLALLRILRVSGTDRALTEVRAAAAGSDAALRDGAQRLLCDWPAENGLPSVRELAAGATNPTVKILALRGLIRLIPASSMASDAKVAELGQVAKLATRSDEQLLVVSALGELPTRSSLELLQALQNEPPLKEAASLAAAKVQGALPAAARP